MSDVDVRNPTVKHRGLINAQSVKLGRVRDGNTTWMLFDAADPDGVRRYAASRGVDLPVAEPDFWIIKDTGWKWEAHRLGDRAAAVLEVGVGRQRVTGTRVLTGALIAGPVGAIVGATARKDLTRLYLSVMTEDGLVEFDVPAKQEAAARLFVSTISTA